jgi:hypothetical protein
MNAHISRLAACLVATLAVGAASAQSLESMAARDVNQQERIQQGLQSGSLNTREAALLQRDQAQVDRLQARSLQDGKLTSAERQRITTAENQASRDIRTAKTNGVTGNPLSTSSQRMQAGVQRDINQEKRIQNGIGNGSLTKREAGALERGQARDSARQAAAGSDGRVTAREQAGIHRAENRQSQHIYNLKHNARVGG